MTRARLLSDAEALIADSERMLDVTERVSPDRAYLARAVLDDAIRAYVLLTSSRRMRDVEPEVAALYVRADIMSRALLSPVQ